MRIVLGDLHVRPKEPFKSALVSFFDWFVESKYNSPDNDLLLLGDLTEDPLNPGEINYIILNLFLNKLKMRNIDILQGNHDYSLESGSNLEIFKALPNVTVYDKPAIMEEGNIKYLLLPYYYPNSNDLPPMEEYYSNLPEEYRQDYDFICHHVTDESIPIVKNHCDLSYLKGNRVGGHHHNFADGYLGSVSLNSVTESGKTPMLMTIDTDTGVSHYEEIPKFVEYYTVSYPEDLPNITTDYAILYIKESVSKEESLTFYKKKMEEQGKELYVRRIDRKRLHDNEDLKEEKRESDRKSVGEYLTEFSTDRKVNSDVVKVIMEVLNAN